MIILRHLRKVLVFLFFIPLLTFSQIESITDYKSELANGKLTIQVRNDNVKYLCENLTVIKGEVQLCDSNPKVSYEYFIKRNVIDSSWLNDVLRQYDDFLDVQDPGLKTPWLNYEKKGAETYKEDFISSEQKTGITYKHHESRKHLIGYTLANPSGKAYADDKKFQFQYDWDENIKGKYEAFYIDGMKKFKHAYEINRIMSLDKGLSGKSKSSIDAQITGSIQSFHPNGKKKAIVTYTDRFIAEKSEQDEARKLVKASRSGEKLVYNENGKLFCKGSFNIKGIDGKLEYYGPKGLVVIKEETYKDGVLNGKVTEYFLDGSIKLKGEYKNGEKVGEWLEFDENGDKIKS